MDANVAKKMLTEWLSVLLRSAEFERDANSKYFNEYFVRPIRCGRQSIGIGASNAYPSVEVSLLITIRLDEVEDIYHLFSQSRPEHSGLSSTIVTPFNYFLDDPSRVTVDKSEDLSTILDGWMTPMRLKVLPYFDAAQDIDSLDKLVNVSYEIIDITNPPDNYMRHIIIAKLANNPDFRDLVLDHRLRMHKIGCNSDGYNKLIEYLESIP